MDIDRKGLSVWETHAIAIDNCVTEAEYTRRIAECALRYGFNRKKKKGAHTMLLSRAKGVSERLAIGLPKPRPLAAGPADMGIVDSLGGAPRLGCMWRKDGGAEPAPLRAAMADSLACSAGGIGVVTAGVGRTKLVRAATAAAAAVGAFRDVVLFVLDMVSF
jgi:hypothetical protein